MRSWGGALAVSERRLRPRCGAWRCTRQRRPDGRAGWADGRAGARRALRLAGGRTDQSLLRSNESRKQRIPGDTQASGVGAPMHAEPAHGGCERPGAFEALGSGKVWPAAECTGPRPEKAAWPWGAVFRDSSVARIVFGSGAARPQPVTCSLSPSVLSPAGSWITSCLLD